MTHASPATVRTSAVQVEAVAGDDRRQPRADPARLPGDCRLDVWIGWNVDDEPADNARQMVMVLPAERLAQLEAVVIASACHALQHADALEDDEVAIQRALRDVGTSVVEEVGHRHWPTRRGDEVEDRPSLPGVALTDSGETTFGGSV